MKSQRDPANASERGIITKTPIRIHESLMIASDREQDDLAKLRDLVDHADPASVTLHGPEGEEYSIPASVYEAIQSIVRVLQRGDGVEVDSLAPSIPLATAAGMLDMPEALIMEHIEQDDISANESESGNGLTIPLADLIQFMGKRDSIRDRLLSELTRLSQEYGLYELR